MVKISQSLMKSYTDYLNGKECGLLFKAKYIDKDEAAWGDPTDAMKVGMYFEYLCTGAKPKDGHIPQPEISWKGTAREKLAAPYDRANDSAKVFKSIVDKCGIKIENVGLRLEDDEISGIIDIDATWNGERVFIDLKYSGLIENKWDEMGWDSEKLPEKYKIWIQALHYKTLAKRCLDIDDIPFYFFVFSASNPLDVKVLRINFDETELVSHNVTIQNTIKKLDYNIQKGFDALPSLSRCAKCPFSESCEKRTYLPTIEDIYIKQI